MKSAKYILFATLSLLLMTVTSSHSSTPVDDTSLVGVWQGDGRRYTFHADGGLEQFEDGTTYRLSYQFDGALLLTIERHDNIEYLDYYYIYMGEDRDTFALTHYEYVHLSATGEHWDPEIMTFSVEKSRVYFSKYCDNFKESSAPLDEWFELYTRE